MGKAERRKMYTLAYTDDIVLLAEEEEGMRAMMARLERYMKGKKLEVNVGKSKIMRFGREGGRRKRMGWWWEGREVEKIRELKYLGYIFQRSSKQEKQVRNRVRREMAVMGQGG